MRSYKGRFWKKQELCLPLVAITLHNHSTHIAPARGQYVQDTDTEHEAWLTLGDYEMYLCFEAECLVWELKQYGNNADSFDIVDGGAVSFEHPISEWLHLFKAWGRR